MMSGQTVSKNRVPTYMRRLTLYIPLDEPWSGRKAEQLAQNLMGLHFPIILSIRATSDDIRWQVACNLNIVQQVTGIIYSLYSNAEIDEQDYRPDIGYFRYDFQTLAPFVFPLVSASDFKEPPLLTIASALDNVSPGDCIVYELKINPPTQDYYGTGERLLYSSGFHWTDFMTKERMEKVGELHDWGARDNSRFEAELMREAKKKLKSPSFSEITFCIKGKDEETFAPIAHQLTAGFFQFSSYNMLADAQPVTYAPILSAGEVAALWHPPCRELTAQKIVRSQGVSSPIPQQLVIDREEPKDVIAIGLNSYRSVSNPVYLKYPDRRTHVQILGRTGVGKSTLMQNMIYQDIQLGKGVGLIDPHGDLVAHILETSIPENRIKDVIIFDTTDTNYPIGLNALAPRPGVPEENIAGAAISLMRTLFADTWSSSRMEDVLTNAFLSLVYREGSTLLDVPRVLSDEEFRKDVLSSVDDQLVHDFWDYEYSNQSPAVQAQIYRPINTRLRRLFRDTTMRRIIGQPDSLDFRGIMDSGKILLVSLAGLHDREHSRLLGALFITQFMMAAMSRHDVSTDERAPFYLYIDEIQNFVTASLPVIFSEARKFGLSMTVANQYMKQLDGKILASIMSNVGANILFRLAPDDAQAVSRFVTENTPFTAEALTNLDRYHTVVKMQRDGQTLPAFSMKTFDGVKPDSDSKENGDAARKWSRQNYGRTAEEIDNLLGLKDPGRGTDHVTQKTDASQNIFEQIKFDAVTNEEDDEFAG